MPIVIEKKQVTVTNLVLKGKVSKKERLKITFESGRVAYFKLTKAPWGRRQYKFVLDNDLLDEETKRAFFPEERMVTDDLDIRTVIDYETYVRLHEVSFDLDNNQLPKVGQPLMGWWGLVIDTGRSGGALLDKDPVKALKIVKA